MLMLRCKVHLKRLESVILFIKCLVARPDILFRHILKLEAFEFKRMNSMTSFSFKSNWNSIASKGVRSSQAISMIRSVSSGENLLGSSTLFTTIYDLVPVALPFFSPRKRSIANRAHFGRQMLFLHSLHRNAWVLNILIKPKK